MLSYRHSYHAGNFADILKHLVLVEIFEHLRQKESPFEYIDTHSGSGSYNLNSAHATKLEEHAGGIDKLNAEHYPELSRYFEVINTHNKASGNTSSRCKYYPGSPAIAKYFLRPQDRAWLYELHPQDYQFLCKNIGANKKIRMQSEDGLAGLLSLLPPKSRRGLILIDPSYEVKAEYNSVFSTIETAYKKFATGTYALWYPVVDRNKINLLEKKLIRSGIKNIQRFELGIAEDSNERGMTSSGMIVINPPWQMHSNMQSLLPKLAKTLGQDNELFYKCDILVGE